MDEDLKTPMDQLSAHLDRGWDLVARGDLAGARLSAEKSLELDEQSAEAHALTGYLLAAEGRVEDALEHYHHAMELEDGHVGAMLNAATLYARSLRDFDQAQRLVDEALQWVEESEERADVLLLKSDLMMQRGDVPGATRVIRTLPKGPFESMSITLAVGRAHFDIGDLDGAEPFFQAALNKSPDNADAHYCVGLLAGARKDRRAMSVAFLKARDLDLAAPPAPWSQPPALFERRVQSAMHKVPAVYASIFEGALVVVSNVPGVEVVAEGIDPRLGVLFDDTTKPGEECKVQRIFVYQQNIEQMAGGLLGVEDEILRGLETELLTHFPDLPRFEGEPGSESASDTQVEKPTEV